jgi:hypothetical protein
MFPRHKIVNFVDGFESSLRIFFSLLTFLWQHIRSLLKKLRLTILEGNKDTSTCVTEDIFSLVIPQKVYFHTKTFFSLLSAEEIQCFLWSAANYVVECLDIYLLENSMA